MKEKIAYLFENWKTIPNLLSFIRILLIPVFAVLFYNGHVIASVVVLALSGLSDMFDGKIARRFNQVSNLGKMLDPIADKLTIATIAVVLFLKFHQAQDDTIRAFSWVFLLFILKDVVMLRLADPEASLNELARLYQAKTGIVVSKSGLKHRFVKIHDLAVKAEGKTDE